MSAGVANSHELDATVRVSSRSLWTDPHWQLDGMRPGLRANHLRVDWSFDLPDASRFTDPRWTRWLEDARQFLWSLRVDPPPGRQQVRARTLVTVFCKLRILIRWMIAENMHGFGGLDRDAAERFLRAVAARRTQRGAVVSATTRHAYANLLLSLYLQRRKLSDPPLEHPFAAERASAFSGFSRHSTAPLPFTPDAIAIPLLSAAIRLIGQPADDVIACATRPSRSTRNAARADCPRPRSAVRSWP